MPSPIPSTRLPISRRAFLTSVRRAGVALLAAPPLCAVGSLLAQESTYASGFNMYGNRGYTRVLMIGDSMSVGGFGEGMAEWLVAKFGRASVAMYAACGSSPEHWLRNEPDYQTHCGYREITPRTNILYDYVGGRRPQPAIAPKVEDLVSILHPRTVIVQLGTNWMDAMNAGDSTKFGEILYRFINAIRSEPGTVRQVIWITPPDSSHYSRNVQQIVLNLIVAGGRKYGYNVVDSTRYTHYTPGRSGGDGIHYNSEEGRAWAAGVLREAAPLLGR